jgi:tRNA(Arg) A34 adenosine deaminase TadA
MTPDAQQAFMRRAIQLSIENVQRNGGPFGAVIVKDGRVVGEGFNRVTATNDPTAHAEVVAIRAACAHLNTFDLSGAEIYSSCEPCPMCLSAIYWARLSCIHYANTKLDAAVIQFDDNFIYDELAKDPARRAIPMRQMLRDEAMQAFRDWQANASRVRY